MKAELINLLYRVAPPMLFSSIVACILLAAVLHGRVPDNRLWLWVSLSLLVTLVRIGLVLVFMLRKPKHEEVGPWGLAYTVLAGVAGFVWSLLAVLFFNPSDLFLTVLLSIVPAALTSNAVGTLAPHLRAYLAFALPVAVAIEYELFVHGGVYSAIGILGLLFFAVSFGNCLNAHRTLRKSIILGFENTELVRQLTEEKERAEAATRDKSRFLAAASHDLRQPIHALGLFGAALRNIARRPQISPSDVADISERLQASVKHLGQLLHAILDTSHLDAGVLKPKIGPVAVMDEFEGLNDKFMEVAARKGSRFVVRRTSEYVLTDPIFLRRILWNLISNALRYTTRGGVLVACRRRGESVEIQVWDTGVGIAEDHQGRIFEDFYRVAHQGREPEHDQGMGLGLAIVRRSAQLLGAPVRVRSLPGRGSMFAVTLPRCAAPAVQPVSELLIAPECLRILVIDDDPVVLHATASLLAEWGHDVVAVGDLASALKAARTETFDRILSDFRLANDVTGVQAIHAVRKQTGRSIPAVIVSGDIAVESMREIAASGLRLLQKPIEPDELRLAVHSPDA
ncbi:ATP-binding protein [Noviherbaspirillum sp.]|uniref:ATP-binding protein n=1 Tax=Noviherbaspirillum sp. TaxID=1926288 RepID=UPI002D76898E|nr:ATP-binding protein [Noviherbaspirillum sp.]